jgi:hypothetical protein
MGFHILRFIFLVGRYNILNYRAEFSINQHLFFLELELTVLINLSFHLTESTSQKLIINLNKIEEKFVKRICKNGILREIL